MSENTPFADETSFIKHGKNYIVKDKFGPENDGKIEWNEKYDKNLL